jgi:hypothetical protein
LYEGHDYVLDVAMRKMQKGRWKKKCFCNEMDDMEMGYDNDIYGSGDFVQMKTKVHCSIYYGEGHNMNRHKQGTKRNPRVCGVKGRNRRSGATAIRGNAHE